MKKKIVPYAENEERLTISDQIGVSDLPLYTYGSTNQSDLSMLSLFSGCGGMDIGFEGGFICHKKSVPSDFKNVDYKVNKNWIRLKPNRFKTIFANDILPEAMCAWSQYMERFGKDPWIYHPDSIVDLVKRHWAGEKVII